MVLDELSDDVLELACAAVHSPPNLSLRQKREEPFDEIEPGRIRWRVVRVKSWTPMKPIANGFGLVGSVVVHDDVRVQFLRNLSVEFPKKLVELLAAVATGTLRVNLTCYYVEGSK